MGVWKASPRVVQGISKSVNRPLTFLLHVNKDERKAATDISKQRNPQGYNAQTQVAKEGGSVAKTASKQLESKLGRSVISESKASDYLLPENAEEEESK